MHFHRDHLIKADSNDVWAVLGRFMHIDEFAPEIASVDALTTGDDQVGSRRRCTFKNGGDIVEEVTEWKEGRGYRVRLSETDPMPLKEGFADIRLEPAGAGQTRVVWGMDFSLKYGPIGWLMGQLMMKPMMGKVLNANLKGLEDRVLATKAA